MNLTDEQVDQLRLARTEGVGPITFHRLMARYGSPEEALEALPVLTKNRPVTICPRDAAQREIDAITKRGGRMVFFGEDAYPEALATIDDAPPVLTVLGNPALLHKKSVALVGSRNASLNARKLTARIARELGEGGYVVTSGLARGIDTAAHEGALATGTIAVVAGGVDVVYPKENQSLYEQICAEGVVVSECALGTQPMAQHFPKRNRIVSGLSEGTVIVEANFRSGSLITARLAAEQGRDVMAVPGFPSDPRSEGTNALIRDGATLVRSAADILEALSPFLRNNSPRQINLMNITGFSDADGSEELIDFTSADIPEPIPQPAPESVRDLILPELSTTPVGVDELIRACHVGTAHIQGALLELELEGTVLRLPGNRVCLAS